ncbi:MAG: 50S ribosomal protein L4 [Subdoligranulum sp.]|nr:50S ribosomal protein L4 [Subdoligranulum sp.]
MAKFDVLDMNGKKVSEVELSDAVFGITPNEKVMHAAVVNFLANQRQGTQSTKTRSEVSGGGKKPWRQKGTGHARQGSTRSPQWTHGGVALGPKPRDYSYRLNKKVRRLALLSALSSKAAGGEMIVIDELAASEYKTKTIVSMLAAIGADKKALLVTPAVDAKLVKSAANIPGVSTATVGTINTYAVLNGGKFVISVDAAKKLEEVYAQ